MCRTKFSLRISPFPLSKTNKPTQYITQSDLTHLPSLNKKLILLIRPPDNSQIKLAKHEEERPNPTYELKLSSQDEPIKVFMFKNNIESINNSAKNLTVSRTQNYSNSKSSTSKGVTEEDHFVNKISRQSEDNNTFLMSQNQYYQPPITPTNGQHVLFSNSNSTNISPNVSPRISNTSAPSVHSLPEPQYEAWSRENLGFWRVKKNIKRLKHYQHAAHVKIFHNFKPSLSSVPENPSRKFNFLPVTGRGSDSPSPLNSPNIVLPTKFSVKSTASRNLFG